MIELAWNQEMLVSAVVLILTFALIFTERLHGFHRAKFALLGALVMVILGQVFGFYSPEDALGAIDWNVVFLLGCMMTIVSIAISTGGFEHIAFQVAQLSGERPVMLLFLLGTVVTVLSLLLDNVTTVVIFGPLIVLICGSLRISPIPYLLAAALLSDTGGAATLVGDPPNLMIGSAAGIDFITFFIHMGGIVLASWLAILLLLRILFRSELSEAPTAVRFDGKSKVKDIHTWRATIFVFAIMIVLFIVHGYLDWEPAFVSAIGLTILLLISSKVDMDRSFQQVEITLLIFFISLFVVVGGVEHSHLLEYIAQFVLPLVESNLLLATIALMWGAAILSSLIDNIPFTAAVIPILLGLQAQGIEVTPLWWALAIGAGMGGNGTHLGSTANVYIVTLSERLAKASGNPEMAITPGLWFRKGTPAMLLSLIVCTLIIWLFFDFFSSPL